jgi:hypothetical protein
MIGGDPIYVIVAVIWFIPGKRIEKTVSPGSIEAEEPWRKTRQPL